MTYYAKRAKTRISTYVLAGVTVAVVLVLYVIAVALSFGGQ